MFEKKDKRRLYWLIDQYLSNKINGSTFCEEFYYCYDLEVDSNTFTKLEENTFSSLSTIVNRFNDIEEDLIKYPGTYFTEDQLRKKVIETKNLLEIDRANAFKV